jgi:hypothetical protein
MTTGKKMFPRSRATALFRCIAGVALLCCGAAYGGPVSSPDSNSRANPDSGSKPWFQGLQLIKSGETIRGIKLLDSLRESGHYTDDFLKEYCRAVFHALVPQRADTEPRILNQFLSTFTDSLDPVSHEWNVIRFANHQEKISLPCFTYGATFEIRKPFHLAFSGFSRSKLSIMQIGYVSNPAPFNSIMRQLEDRKAMATCRLFIDLNADRSPAFEYLSRRINGVYDSISVKPELRAFRGLSLRCYTVSRYADRDGKYTAVASFDRTIPDPRTGGAPARAEKKPETIRYTLVVQSSSDVKDLLEAKFQSLLRAFL